MAKIYTKYRPATLKVGRKHPTEALEVDYLNVAAPEVYYELSIPRDPIDSGQLSQLELESMTYAAQAHANLLPDGSRAGFLIGDGPGVGKGRTIAGIIYENFLRGRKKAIWIHVSDQSVVRDLTDIGATQIVVRPLKFIAYGSKINSEVNVLLSTYSTLISTSANDKTGKYRPRLRQLLQWCGEDFEGLIIFDEWHKAKDLFPTDSAWPTKIGRVVLQLQRKLPKARVVYASSMGVSEPRSMEYMLRLGLWGRGTEFNDFIKAVERRGVGAMEIVAMDMKLRGMYIARQLSFKGVKFRIEEVPLTKKFRKIYDQSVELWVEARQKFTEAAELMDTSSSKKLAMWGQFWSSHHRFFKYLCIDAKVSHAIMVAREATLNGDFVVIGLHPTGEARTLDQREEDYGDLTDFVSTAQFVFGSLVERFFPAPNSSQEVNRILEQKEQIVPLGGSSNCNINNSSSAAAATKRKGEGTSNDEASSRKQERGRNNSDSDNEHDDNKSDADSSDQTVEKNEATIIISTEPIITTDDMANVFSTLSTAKASKSHLGRYIDALMRALRMKRELIRKINRLGKSLPSNVIDLLTEELGGPKKVRNLTVSHANESSTYGQEDVGIILEAVSSGIAMHSDRRDQNARRRVHIMVDMPCSPDQALLHFGRTHRANQVCVPEFVCLVSDLGGERHFASTLAMRLESLGAHIYHGDRQATESRDISLFNFVEQKALTTVMRTIMGYETPLVPLPTDYSGEFLQDTTDALLGVGLIMNSESSHPAVLTLNCDNISMFIDRILGCPVDLQIALFKYFTDTLTAIVQQAKCDGSFDLGITDFSAEGIVTHVARTRFLRKHPSGLLPTDLHTFRVGLRQRKYHILNGAVLSVLDRIEHILETSGSNCKIQLIRMKTVTGQVHIGILIPKSCFESLCEDLRSDSANSAVFSY